MRQQRLYLLTAAVIGILMIVHLNLRAYAFDDAYIHFRIAGHLAEYGQPYFNTGEAVMASTSSGWTVILAFLFRTVQMIGIHPDPAVIASIINAIAAGAGAAIFLAIFKRLIPTPHHWLVEALFYLTYLAMVLPSSIGLMEIPTTIALAGLAVLLLMRRSRWSMLCLGILPFFRPELIVVTVLGILLIIATRRFPIKEVVLFTFLGAVPFIAYELVFFKSLIPNTMTTKSIVYSLTYIAAGKYFIQKIFDDLALLEMALPISISQKIIFAGIELWLLASLITIFLYKLLRQLIKNGQLEEIDQFGILFFAWSAAIVGVYLYKRVFIFSWYDPLYSVPLAVILGKVVFDSFKKKLVPALGILVIPLMLGQFSSLAQVGLGAFVDVRFAPEFLYSARVRNYIEVAKGLDKEYPNARLMTSEIGGIGYGFQGYIYDGVGLVSPDALKFHPLQGANSIGGIPAGFVAEKNPELIVSYDVFMQDLENSPVLENYVRIKLPVLLPDDLRRAGPGRIFNSDALNVFIRKDIAPRVYVNNPLAGFLAAIPPLFSPEGLRTLPVCGRVHR